MGSNLRTNQAVEKLCKVCLVIVEADAGGVGTKLLVPAVQIFSLQIRSNQLLQSLVLLAFIHHSVKQETNCLQTDI